MKQKTLLISIAVCVVLVSGFFSAGVVYGQYGLDETAGAAGLKQYGTDLPTIAGNIIGTGLSMISVMFFGLMIYGGIRWMIARGKEEEAKKAMDTIIAATIGIIIVLASYAITNFVFKSVSGGAVINSGGTSASGSKQFCGIDCGSAKECKVLTVAAGEDEIEKAAELECQDVKEGECPASCSSQTYCGDATAKTCIAFKDLQAQGAADCGGSQSFPSKEACEAVIIGVVYCAEAGKQAVCLKKAECSSSEQEFAGMEQEALTACNNGIKNGSCEAAKTGSCSIKSDEECIVAVPTCALVDGNCVGEAELSCPKATFAQCAGPKCVWNWP